jgi:hypothetical protein
MRWKCSGPTPIGFLTEGLKRVLTTYAPASLRSARWRSRGRTSDRVWRRQNAHDACGQALDSEGERARDETVKAFHDTYQKNSAEFPPEARETHYAELLRLSYPIHPELFERLSKDWASLDKFQRTRGCCGLWPTWSASYGVLKRATH